MPVIAVVGGQWGDEGKGKIVDFLAQQANVVIRATGGNNAGHTIINEMGERALHVVPCGICTKGVSCVIGAGVVVELGTLRDEIQGLQKDGIEVSPRNLLISPKAHIVFPWHIAQDGAEEKRRGQIGKLGTTLRGIGPAFADKAARVGLRTGDLRDTRLAEEKFRALYDLKNALLRSRIFKYRKLGRLESLLERFREQAQFILPYIRDTDSFVWEAMDAGKTILLEGAQGSLLDIDEGTYPYVTSSGCTTAALAKGSSINPRRIDKVVGVFKAYVTRVGTGPFPTEASDDLAGELRERGKEYGATTGRPRRCGWFDGPIARLAVRLNGIDEIALTKMDILGGREIQFAFSYGPKDPLAIGDFPKIAIVDELHRAYPIYYRFSSWEEDIAACQSFDEFPEAAKEYVRAVKRATGVPIRYISTGPKRGQMVVC